MGFTASWSTLLGELEELSEEATLITPLSQDRFIITDVRKPSVDRWGGMCNSNASQ
jgi:hypothetical protein